MNCYRTNGPKVKKDLKALVDLCTEYNIPTDDVFWVHNDETFLNIGGLCSRSHIHD